MYRTCYSRLRLVPGRRAGLHSKVTLPVWQTLAPGLSQSAIWLVRKQHTSTFDSIQHNEFTSPLHTRSSSSSQGNRTARATNRFSTTQVLAENIDSNAKIIDAQRQKSRQSVDEQSVRQEHKQGRAFTRVDTKRRSFQRQRGGNGQPKGKRSLAAIKEEKSNYLQWGYLRHQYPKADVLSARRTFKLWKEKYAKVMNPKNPASWPWREDGKWLFDLPDVGAMRQAWVSLSHDKRLLQWPLVMLSTLHLAPDRAAAVLEATMEPLPPGYAIHDVLQVIVKQLQLDRLKTTREKIVKAEETLELITKMVEDTPKGHVHLGQRTLGVLARKLPPEQVFELHTILSNANIRLHPNTMLHFASSLAQDMAHKPTAFDILKSLAEEGADLNEARPASVITSLLHCKTSSDGWSQQKREFSSKNALQYFMEKGLSPNVINSTAFLDSLCQQGEPEEAIRLALLFAESGVQLDAKAWSTVFRGAKHSLKVENVLRALDVAKVSRVPYEDVLCNALHAVLYFTDMESRDKKRSQPPWILPLFGPMLRIYAKKFDLEPLQWWLPDSLPLIMDQESKLGGDKFGSPKSVAWDVEDSIIPIVDKLFSVGDGPRLKPTSTAIAIMLRSYLKSLQHSYDVMSFYSFFKSRLEERDTDDGRASKLMRDQGSLLHDAFIMAMTERKGLSRPALQVFGDMLKDYLRTVGSVELFKVRANRGDSIEATTIHPPPSLCTFSILIHGLLNQGERLLAEQVMQVMREHGIEPNLVTWNTLAKGYASMQNIPQTVATLRGMEAAGLKPDLFTFKAFGKLKDQSKALKVMENIIDVNRKKIAEEEVYD